MKYKPRPCSWKYPSQSWVISKEQDHPELEGHWGQRERNSSSPGLRLYKCLSFWENGQGMDTPSKHHTLFHSIGCSLPMFLNYLWVLESVKHSMLFDEDPQLQRLWSQQMWLGRVEECRSEPLCPALRSISEWQSCGWCWEDLEEERCIERSF